MVKPGRFWAMTLRRDLLSQKESEVRAIQSTKTVTIICPTGAIVLKQRSYCKAKLFGTLD